MVNDTIADCLVGRCHASYSVGREFYNDETTQSKRGQLIKKMMMRSTFFLRVLLQSYLNDRGSPVGESTLLLSCYAAVVDRLAGWHPWIPAKTAAPLECFLICITVCYIHAAAGTSFPIWVGLRSVVSVPPSP